VTVCRWLLPSLLHDVGVLYMAPAWRDPQNKVTGIERKHLVAHPITAMLMVRDAQVYSRAVEDAVLEHHERMDGTGYPAGVGRGADIAPGPHPHTGRNGGGVLRKSDRHACAAALAGAASEPSQVSSRSGGPCAALAAGGTGPGPQPGTAHG